jgi:hypothetical protein
MATHGHGSTGRKPQKLTSESRFAPRARKWSAACLPVLKRLRRFSTVAAMHENQLGPLLASPTEATQGEVVISEVA